MEKGHAPGKRKRSVINRVFHFVTNAISTLLLIAFVALIGLNAYLQCNKTKILKDLPFLNQGLVSFQSANLSIFWDFPLATVSLKNVSVQDSLFYRHQKHLLHAGTLQAGLSLEKIFDNQVDIQLIKLLDGEINLFTDSTGYCNFKSLFSKDTTLQLTQAAKKFKLLTDELTFALSNMSFHFSDATKTSDIRCRVDKLKADLQKRDTAIFADIDMSINMKGLTFKEGQGTFASDSQLEGKFDLELKNGILTFEPFELKINEEHFTVGGNFDTQKTTISTFFFENKETHFANCLPLLSDPIRRPLMPITIEGPFYSKTTVSGYFKPNNPPIVHVEFALENNQITANGNEFKQVGLNGEFKNRLYDDDRAWEEPKGRFKLSFVNLNAKHGGFAIHSGKTLITSEAKNAAQLRADLEVRGRPNGISKWFGNDQFFFTNGHFELKADVQGPLNDYNQLVTDSRAELAMNDFSVIYRPANSAFPLEGLFMVKERGDTEFNIVNKTFQKGYGYQIDGGLKNLPALLFKIAERASSNATFTAKKISWADFLNLFGENGYLKNNKPKTDQQKKKSLKETLRGIQVNFQPSLAIFVDTLQYFDLLELHDFKTGAYFENEHTVVLEKTSFKYGVGEVSFQIKMDISDPEQTPFELEMHADKINLKNLLPPFDYFNIKLLAGMEHQPENVSIDITHKGILDDQNGLIPSTSTGEIIFKVDEGDMLLGKINYEPAANPLGKKSSKLGGSVKTKIQLEGNPVVFNEFFKTDQFFFDKGQFSVQFEYEGNVTDFGELLNRGNASFTLKNSEVYYKIANVVFPITQLDLDVTQDNADFKLHMWFDSLRQTIDLDGNIQNLSAILLENTGKQVKTAVDVTTPKVKWKQLVYVFAPENAPELEQKQSIDALKATVKGLLSTFDPNLHVYIDTFVYSDKLMLHEVETGMRLMGNDTLVLDKTGFRFQDGQVSVNGMFNLGIKDAAPFSANFITDKLDVVGLLESLDYLDLPSLKNLDELSGNTTLNLYLSGIIADDAKGLIAEANDGSLAFGLSDIIVKGFEPLDVIAAKIKMKKRFKEIRFAPIENNLIIKGPDIHIPQMEIQSNALNMFVEGTLSYADNTNIWVSIPIDNLNSKDRSIIPPKRGYAASGKKVYVEVTTDKEGNNRFRFRSSKKKFYKQRNILDQYKRDKKAYRMRKKAGF